MIDVQFQNMMLRVLTISFTHNYHPTPFRSLIALVYITNQFGAISPLR